VSRRRSSNLYQVDFVAALFSGFLLVWLATTAESDFTANGSTGPIFYILEAKLYYGSAPGDSLVNSLWISSLPDVSLHESCAPLELISYIDKSVSTISGCNYNDEIPRASAEKTEALMATVLRRSKESHVNLDHNVIPTLGLNFRLLDDAPGEQDNYPTVGLALSKISVADEKSYAFSNESRSEVADPQHIHVSVGIIPDGTRLPTEIEIGSAVEVLGGAAVRSAIFGVSISETQPAPPQPAPRGSIVYTFEPFERGLQLSETTPRPLKLEIRLLIDPAGNQRCLTAETTGNLTQTRQKLQLQPTSC
jgi:hypothetical protein